MIDIYYILTNTIISNLYFTTSINNLMPSPENISKCKQTL